MAISQAWILLGLSEGICVFIKDPQLILASGEEETDN